MSYYEEQLNEINFQSNYAARIKLEDSERHGTKWMDLNKESAAAIVKKLVDEFDLELDPEFKYPPNLVNAFNATSSDDPPGSDIIESYGSWLERQLNHRIKVIEEMWIAIGAFSKAINRSK